MALFRPRALIFFVFWCPGAPIFDAVGLLFGFRGALGALIAARWCPWKVAEKSLPHHIAQQVHFGEKWCRKGAPQKNYRTQSGTFWAHCFQRYPPRCKKLCTCRAIRKNWQILYRRYYFVPDTQYGKTCKKTMLRSRYNFVPAVQYGKECTGGTISYLTCNHKGCLQKTCLQNDCTKAALFPTNWRGGKQACLLNICTYIYIYI